MEYVKFAVKPKHPLRKAIDDVLYPHKDFLDIIECGAGAQALTWLKNSHVAIMDDAGKYYPVDEDNILEQFDLVAAGEAPTVEEDAEFGIPKLTAYVTDPITGGETVESDVLGVQLGHIQDGVEVYNGITTGVLYKVTNYTGFNSADVNEQNGYYLVFFNKVADAEAVGYTDQKFFVVGGTGNKVTPDEGMNIIFLGATPEDAYKKKLGMTATLTTKTTAEDGTEVTNTEEVTVVFENRLRCVDLEEGLLPANPLAEAVAEPIVDTANKKIYLNGVEGSVRANSNGKGAEIVANGKVLTSGYLTGWTLFGGGKPGTHFPSSRINVTDIQVGGLNVVGGGEGSYDQSEDPTLSADVDETVVVVNGNCRLNNVIGGGYGRSTVKKSSVVINGGTYQTLSGGGIGYIDAEHNVNSGSNVNPENSPCVVEDANLVINNATLNTNGLVYGAGSSGYTCTKTSHTTINNISATNGWCIGGSSNGYVGNAFITVNDTKNIKVLGNINRGWSENATLTVNGGTIASVYAGADEEDTETSAMEKHGCQGKLKVVINGGTITSLLPGYNYSAIQANDPKVEVFVGKNATVTNIDAAKTAFGTSITVEEAEESAVTE